MRLTKLHLENFRNHKQTTIGAMSQLNVFGGLNASGKSSILDAIVFGLTGTCRGADTGRSLDELRTTGSRHRMSVKLTGVHKDQVLDLLRYEDEGPRAAKQVGVNDFLGLPPATVRACLYSTEFARLERKDMARMILDLAKGASGVKLPEHLRKLLGGLQDQEWDLAAIEGFHKRLAEERTQAGRFLKALGTEQTAERPEWLRPDDEIDGLRFAMESRINDLDAERSAKRERWSVYQDALDLRTTGEAELATLKRKTYKTVDEVSALGKGLMDRLNKAEDAIRDYRGKLAGMKQKEDHAREQRVLLMEELERFLKVGETCPTCRQKMSEAKRVAYAKQLEASVLQRGTELSAWQAEQEALRPPKGTEEIEAAILALDQEDQDRNRHAQLIEELEARLKTPLEPVDDPSLVVLALTERIRKGKARLEEFDRYLGALDASVKRERNIAGYQAEYDELQAAVEYLSPTGPVRQELASLGGVQEFQAELAGHLAVFGWTLDLGPLMELKDDPMVNGRPSRLLSESEKLRFGLAFGVAVADWSGLGIVAIDGWEILDTESTLAAGSVLADCEQAFIFQTPKKGIEEYKQLQTAMARSRNPAMKVFVVEDGMVR